MQKLLSSSTFNLLSFVIGLLCFCGFFYAVVLTFTESYVAVKPPEVAPVVKLESKPEVPKRYVPPAEVELPFF